MELMNEARQSIFHGNGDRVTRGGLPTCIAHGKGVVRWEVIYKPRGYGNALEL